MKRVRLDQDVRREQILKGALAVFARKGFTEATNRDIAEEVGIASPGLIYHYYPSKSDLLLAVLTHHTPVLRLLDNAEELGQKDLQTVLSQVGNAYLDFFENRDSIALMKILMGEAVRNPEFAGLFGQLGPLRMISFLNGYFERQMQLGHLKTCHPDLATRSFVGPMMSFALTRVILGIEPEHPPSRPEVLAHVIDTFLNGMRTQ